MAEKPKFALFENTGVDPYSLNCAQQLVFGKNEKMLLPNGIGLIARGKVRVTSKENGTLLNEITAGGLFGASTLFAGENRAMTVLTAAESETCIIFIPEKEFSLLLRQNSDLLESYLGFVSNRICFLNGKLNMLSSATAESKLLYHIIQNGGSVKTKSMTELAKILSLGRASLYRAVENLERENKIKRNGKELSVTDTI